MALPSHASLDLTAIAAKTDRRFHLSIKAAVARRFLSGLQDQ